MKRLLVILFFAMFAVSAFSADMQIITMQAAIKAACEQAEGIVLKIGIGDYHGKFVYNTEILSTPEELHKIDVSGTDGAIARHRTDSKHQSGYYILSHINLTHEQIMAGVTATVPGGFIYDSELNIKNGKTVFEQNLVDGEGFVYEAVVEAMSGTLISLKKDDRFLSAPEITKAAAEKAALEKNNGQILYTRLDKETGTFYYYVNIISGDTLRKIKVNGHNGAVVEQSPVPIP